jgi:hypothetical protein
MTTLRDLCRAGAEGLRSQCPGCGSIAIHRWRTLAQPPDASLASIRRRSHCERCGSRPGRHDVQPYSHSQAQPTAAQSGAAPAS